VSYGEKEKFKNLKSNLKKLVKENMKFKNSFSNVRRDF